MMRAQFAGAGIIGVEEEGSPGSHSIDQFLFGTDNTVEPPQASDMRLSHIGYSADFRTDDSALPGDVVQGFHAHFQQEDSVPGGEADQIGGQERVGIQISLGLDQ